MYDICLYYFALIYNTSLKKKKRLFYLYMGYDFDMAKHLDLQKKMSI